MHNRIECRTEARLKLSMAENILEWEKWGFKIPAISFPAHWKIRIIPPTVGALVRFHVFYKNVPGEYISVYLDAFDFLGSIGGEPYWEIYPYSKDDPTARYSMNDVDGLLHGIRDALENLEWC